MRPNLKAGDPNYDSKTSKPTRFVEVKVPRDESIKDAIRLGRKSGLQCIQCRRDGDVSLLGNLMRLNPKAFAEASGDVSNASVMFIND